MEEIFKRRDMLQAMQAFALSIGDLDRFDELASMLATVDDLLSYVTSPDDTPTEVYARVVAAKAH